MNESVNESVNDRGNCRTAPATSGLLNMYHKKQKVNGCIAIGYIWLYSHYRGDSVRATPATHLIYLSSIYK